MAQPDTAAFTRKATSIAWEGFAGLDDTALDDLAPAPTDRQRRGHVRQMLLAAAIATGGIVAVAAVMMMGVL